MKGLIQVSLPGYTDEYVISYDNGEIDKLGALVAICARKIKEDKNGIDNFDPIHWFAHSCPNWELEVCSGNEDCPVFYQIGVTRDRYGHCQVLISHWQFGRWKGFYDVKEFIELINAQRLTKHSQLMPIPGLTIDKPRKLRLPKQGS